jgi:uncharacterized membrane-anchored protein YhcB (DUF1043 family)
LTTSTLIIGLSCLAAGLLLGFILARALHPKEQQRKELENNLQQAQEQIKDYQQDVTDHFLKTSELVNNLSQCYRDVHEHLATGAMRLTNTEISRQMIDAGFGRNKAPNIITEEPPEPPKDYAPKVPGGVLSEEYGLKEETPPLNPANPNLVNEINKPQDEEEDPTLKVS